MGPFAIVEVRTDEPFLVSSKSTSKGSTTAETSAPLSKRARSDYDLSRPANQDVELRANSTNGNGSSGSRSFHLTYNNTKDFPVAYDLDGMAHLYRYFKPAGCPIPAVRNLAEHDAYIEMATAARKVNSFTDISRFHL